jgi:LmbE family N-acetylglucosaminyl deacetylase
LCDHEAAAVLAENVRQRHPYLTLWAYPIWGWHLAASAPIPAPAPQGAKLAIDEVMEQKRNAIRAHTSQMTSLIADDPDGFRFTEETLAPFLQPYEYFIEVMV